MRSMLRVLALCALILAVPSGCAVEVGAPTHDCVARTGAPISARALLVRLRSGGYDAFRADGECGGAADIVAAIDATSRRDHTENIYCTVRRRTIYGPGFHKLATTLSQGAPFSRDNVECALYTGKHEAAERAHLERVLRTE